MLWADESDVGNQSGQCHGALELPAVARYTTNNVKGTRTSRAYLLLCSSLPLSVAGEVDNGSLGSHLAHLHALVLTRTLKGSNEGEPKQNDWSWVTAALLQPSGMGM